MQVDPISWDSSVLQCGKTAVLSGSRCYSLIETNLDRDCNIHRLTLFMFLLCPGQVRLEMGAGSLRLLWRRTAAKKSISGRRWRGH
jgi:hypothetical protein